MGSGKRKERSASPYSGSGTSSEGAKRHKKKSKHKHKHKKHKDKEKEVLLAQAEQFLKQQLKVSGSGSKAETIQEAGLQHVRGSGLGARPISKPAGVDEISDEDYFLRSTEFMSWVQEAKHKFFNELSGEESSKLFSEFVAAWNGGHLPIKYYQGLVAAPARRTAHDWHLKGGCAAGGKKGMAGFLEDQQDKERGMRSASQRALAADRHSWRQEQKLVMDELLPKATGRDAKVEARIARREEARAREESPDQVRAPGGGDIMGGDDSFAAAKAREAARAARRSTASVARKEELASKLAAAAAAEEAKMAQGRFPPPPMPRTSDPDVALPRSHGAGLVPDCEGASMPAAPMKPPMAFLSLQRSPGVTMHPGWSSPRRASAGIATQC